MKLGLCEWHVGELVLSALLLEDFAISACQRFLCFVR